MHIFEPSIPISVHWQLCVETMAKAYVPYMSIGSELHKVLLYYIDDLILQSVYNRNIFHKKADVIWCGQDIFNILNLICGKDEFKSHTNAWAKVLAAFIKKVITLNKLDIKNFIIELSSFCLIQSDISAYNLDPLLNFLNDYNTQGH